MMPCEQVLKTMSGIYCARCDKYINLVDFEDHAKKCLEITITKNTRYKFTRSLNVTKITIDESNIENQENPDKL